MHKAEQSMEVNRQLGGAQNNFRTNKEVSDAGRCSGGGTRGVRENCLTRTSAINFGPFHRRQRRRRGASSSEAAAHLMSHSLLINSGARAAQLLTTS